MTKNDENRAARQLPADLANVALIDAQTCAAAGGMSVSWWLERVRTGTAPAPAVRAVRCTRWHMGDVSAFWRNFAAKADGKAEEMLSARAKKASVAAQAKRSAAVAVGQ